MRDFHILYLDNNSFIANQVKIRLEWKGYQVVTTDNEQALLKKIRHQSYDLLIVDLLTPKPNAFSLLECLKEQKIMPPTIVVHDDKDFHLVTTSMHLGCLDYVVKEPLIKNYFDQLNLSIFQIFEKKQCLKTVSHQQNKSRKHSATNPLTSTTNWEYCLDQDLVQWAPQRPPIKIASSYDEFTEKIHLEALARVKTQSNICLF